MHSSRTLIAVALLALAPQLRAAVTTASIPAIYEFERPDRQP